MTYVFFAPGFEEIEGLTVVDVLRRAQIPVTMVGVGGKQITGSHGITVVCDILEEAIDVSALRMVVLPGGMPGTLQLEQSEIVRAAISHAIANDLWLAAICAAPSILGHMGVLDGKKVTVFPGFENQLIGAKIVSQAVVQDGKLITANGAGNALPFALRLVEVLKDRKEAQGIADSMQWTGVL